MVDKNALADAAEKLGLIHLVLYDKRYIKGSKEGIRTIISDCMEALIGAIYLDKGLEGARGFINNNIIIPNYRNGNYQIDKNYKGQLLEYTHAEKLEPPLYKLIKEDGPDHAKIFYIEVIIGEKSYGIGKGKNKKTAEQNSAKTALEQLKD